MPIPGKALSTEQTPPKTPERTPSPKVALAFEEIQAAEKKAPAGEKVAAEETLSTGGSSSPEGRATFGEDCCSESEVKDENGIIRRKALGVSPKAAESPAKDLTCALVCNVQSPVLSRVKSKLDKVLQQVRAVKEAKECLREDNPEVWCCLLREENHPGIREDVDDLSLEELQALRDALINYGTASMDDGHGGNLPGEEEIGDSQEETDGESVDGKGRETAPSPESDEAEEEVQSPTPAAGSRRRSARSENVKPRRRAAKSSDHDRVKKGRVEKPRSKKGGGR
ncbi:hypothetical protein GE09DRAFT_1217869 [Coniochaeta sp. 2T2.1]|nr:hypothetical protein GE09DRAFT_1217869 [Coniochaeta sp. 2T2.1]